MRSEAARFAYVYAVAFQSTGDLTGPIRVLAETHRRRRSERGVLPALATYLGERGDVQAGLRYAETLAALVPDDADVRRPVEALRQRPAG